MSAVETEPGRNINGEIRAIAYDLGGVLRYGVDVSILESPNVEIAKLTAGHDPDAFSTNLPEYAAGAETALSMVVGAMAENLPSVAAMEKIKQPDIAALITWMAEAGSLPESELLKIESEDSHPANKVQVLKAIGFIEPAIPKEESDGRTWEITAYGKEIYPRILPQLVKAVGIDETLNGLRGILENS